MLLEYKFSNFRSFKDLCTLSMIAARSFKEHEPDNIIKYEKEKILKTAVIYGNNASGKSNLIRGLETMKRLVKSSFRDVLMKKGGLNIEKFLLNTENENTETLFEVCFVHKKIKYKYGFELGINKIVKEWLYYTKTKEVFLFIRENGKVKINKTSFKEGLNLDSKTREDVLFLSVVAQFNGMISNNVIEWFDSVNIISGIQDRGYSTYTIEKLKNDKNFNKWLSLIIKTLEISNLTIEEVDLNNDDVTDIIKRTNNEKIVKLFEALNQIGDENPKKIQISTWHRKYDGDNLLIDTIPFNFESQESEGTKKFIHLLGPWYDTLKNGKTLIIDELDSRLHTQLTKKLIELFHKHNKNAAQLIFTSHDTTLLDKELFRRDQIWFTEKGQFGSSQLYSLADFKTENVRNTSSFLKNYLNGKYGAISFFDISDDLVELLYNG